MQKEHIGIREKKKSPDDPLTWEDFKSMHFTKAVININQPSYIYESRCFQFGSMQLIE